MASTTFIDKQTVITAEWAQDVNDLVYNGEWPGATPSFLVNLAAGATAVTPAAGDNDTSVATSAFVQQEINSAEVNQTKSAFTTTGSSGVYTLTPTTALTSLVAGVRYNVKFHVASTPSMGSTLQVSALVPKNVFQYDSTGTKINPVISTGQLSDVMYDGTDFIVLDPLPPSPAAVVGATPVRQTVLSGATDTSGRASFITGGAGLTASLSATATALTLAFAGGFGSGGQTDFIERITADNSAFWTGLSASNLNYLSMTRVGSGNVTGGATLAPVQYGYSYDQTKQALLHFDGSAGSTTMIDDFGNTWTAQSGAKLQTNSVKFGLSGLGGTGTNNALNGTSDYIRSTVITGLPRTGWSLRAWVNPSALPTAGNNATIVQVGTAAAAGAWLSITNSAGSIKFSYFLSSNGTTQDIASAVQGTTTPVIGTYYFVELTHDIVAGIYRLYVNGVQEASTTNANFVNQSATAVSLATIGARTDAAANNFLNGYIDEFEFLPYCDHPNAVSYSVPVGAKSVAAAGYSSDWFDLASFTMKTPSAASAVAGTNPTFTTSNKLYVGEATTNATTVTNAVSYAFQGKYISGSTAVTANTAFNFSHNIGVPNEVLDKVVVKFRENGTVGWRDAQPQWPANGTGGAFSGYITDQGPTTAGPSNNNVSIKTAATNVGHTVAGAAATTGFYLVQVKRAF